MPDAVDVHSVSAAVLLRARRSRCKASVPIDQILIPAMQSHARGLILLVAPPGGGKTYAIDHLRHLTSQFQAGVFFDQHQADQARAASRSHVVVLAAEGRSVDDCIDVFEIAPWTVDDCMEYLLARDRASCGSVLQRLGIDASLRLLNGSPQLLSAVMEEMIADPALQTCREAIRCLINEFIPTGQARDRLMIDGPSHARLSVQALKWWRHEVIRNFCLADWIAEKLTAGELPDRLQKPIEPDLIAEIAASVTRSREAIAFLEKSIERDRQSNAVPMAVSILLQAVPGWKPKTAKEMNLGRALLSGACWAGVDLRGARLTDAICIAADFSGANLDSAYLEFALLGHAKLCGASLKHASLMDANLG